MKEIIKCPRCGNDHIVISKVILNKKSGKEFYFGISLWAIMFIIVFLFIGGLTQLYFNGRLVTGPLIAIFIGLVGIISFSFYIIYFIKAEKSYEKRYFCPVCFNKWDKYEK